MKRIALLLMLITVLSSTDACSERASQPDSGASQPSQTVPAPESAAPEAVTGDPYALPMTTEPVTFSYLVDENPSQYKSKTEHLPITAEIERLTGINLKIEAVPMAEITALISTRMAAGTDLPDIIRNILLVSAYLREC